MGLSMPFLDEKLESYQEKSDDDLHTDNKEIVGAINELKENIDSIEIPESDGCGTIVYVDDEAVVEFDADTKVDKIIEKDGNRALYGNDGNGTDLRVPLQKDNSGAGTVPVYSTDLGESEPEEGNLVSASPERPYQVSTKKYVDDRFDGSNKAAVFDSYKTMINTLNEANSTDYHVGQNIMIITLNVPDLWISKVESSKRLFQHTTDENFVAQLDAMKEDGVKVGYYRLSALETQKVDLGNYVSMYSEQLSDGSYSLKLVKEV